ncbi:MAG: 5-oxoprolinase subunit PxpB [Eubacteriales bacterium]|nr:5-oxoprolinase subunit PxpB [Eubacteriales bacterium]
MWSAFRTFFGKKPEDGRRILPAGDCALTVEFGNAIDEALNRKVQRLNENLKRADIPGIVETVPTFRSLMVTYDPSRIGFEKLKKELSALPAEDGAGDGASRRVVEIPVCYGGAYGEDLKDVAAHAGMTEEEVIRLHSSVEYNIYMLGFLPGFPYLGGLDRRLFTPRLDNPRTKIPAGSVGIGGEQTGIYPLESPGGWRLIGRTPLKLYDPEREEPFLYQAGDYIRFVPITAEEYEARL